MISANWKWKLLTCCVELDVVEHGGGTGVVGDPEGINA